MQNKTIIMVDAILLISLPIFLIVIKFTAGFTFAEIFASPLDDIDHFGPLAVVPFAISLLFAYFGHVLSAKIIMGVGFAGLGYVLFALVYLHLEYI
jgi:hypothetical protein